MLPQAQKVESINYTRSLLTDHSFSDCFEQSSKFWPQHHICGHAIASGHLATRSLLQRLQHPMVTWLSLATFPAGFLQAKSMVKLAGKVTICPGKLLPPSPAQKQPLPVLLGLRDTCAVSPTWPQPPMVLPASLPLHLIWLSTQGLLNDLRSSLNDNNGDRWNCYQ